MVLNAKIKNKRQTVLKVCKLENVFLSTYLLKKCTSSNKRQVVKHSNVDTKNSVVCFFVIFTTYKSLI